MNISKEKLKQLIEYAFNSGLNYGGGVDHDDKRISEAQAWEEFWENNKQKFIGTK